MAERIKRGIVKNPTNLEKLLNAKDERDIRECLFEFEIALRYADICGDKFDYGAYLNSKASKSKHRRQAEKVIKMAIEAYMNDDTGFFSDLEDEKVKGDKTK